jgi:hypothetical protein
MIRPGRREACRALAAPSQEEGMTWQLRRQSSALT